MRRLAPGVLAVVVLSGVGVSSQDVIDRILSTVGTEIVTVSDVERCRRLRLLSPASDTPEGWRIALENRLLILRDIARPGLAQPPPDPASVEARRRQWAASLDPALPVAAHLDRSGMSPEALDTWLADDVRIEHYLAQRFGALQQAARSQATADFVARLRRAAELR